MSRRTATADVFDQVCDTDDEQRPAPPVSHWQPDDENSATAADDSASEPDVTTPQATGARGRRVGLRTVVTGLLLALSLATSVVFVWQAHTRHQLDAAREQALQAAKDYAVVLTTLDVTNIDANYRDTLAGATGKFKDDYSQGSSQMRQILIDNHASGTGIVVDAAVKSATPTRVEVLLFVDQSITNAANPSPRIDRNRIDMTMEKVGDRWLASRVEIL